MPKIHPYFVWLGDCWIFGLCVSLEFGSTRVGLDFGWFEVGLAFGAGLNSDEKEENHG